MKRNFFGRWAHAAPLLAVLGLTGCAAAGYEPFSDDTDGQAQSYEGEAIKSVMSAIGAIDPQDKPIEYKPRAALVIPPKRDLKTPEDPDALLASRNFPQNPEDRRRSGGSPGGDSSKVMSLAEQEKFSNLPRARQAPAMRPAEENGRLMTVEEMQRGHGSSKEVASGTGAKRKTLLDPPDAYSKPNPNAPIGEEKPKETSWKPSWWPL